MMISAYQFGEFCCRSNFALFMGCKFKNWNVLNCVL